MNLAAEFSPFLHDLFPGASEELLTLLGSAAKNGHLLHVDFYTIRDLLDLSGYEADEAVHVLLLELLLALEEGSLCIEASEDGLARRLVDLVEEPSARAWARRVHASLEKGGCSRLIGRLLEEGKPVVLLETEGRNYLYFQKYLKHEQILVEELRKRLCGAAAPVPGNLAEVMNEVQIAHPLQVAGRPVQLNRDQQTALGLALLRSFVIVSGGPGTGKTSIVVTLLRCLVRCGLAPERIALAAPTGRAAQRLTDALRLGLDGLGSVPAADQPLAGLTAHTLHHLLHYHPGRGTYLHHAENPLPADVVIVDEVSMVGVQLMARLFQALRPDTRLVLLGDKDQLSSVDAGAVLANLVPSGSRPSFSQQTCTDLGRLLPDTGSAPLQDVLVVLEENYRSQRHIQEVARAINAQRPEIVKQLRPVLGASLADLQQQGGCWLLEQAAGNLSVWRELLEQWAHHHYLNPSAGTDGYQALVARCLVAGSEVAPEQKAMLDRLFALLQQGRILTLVREGHWGCEGINLFLEQRLRQHLDPGNRGGPFAGMPVLVTRNDYGRQLFNGDVGLALKSGGGYRVVFQRQGGYVSLPCEALPAHELAFALTVHKAQGSEYEQVLLVLPPDGGRRLLTKEMIYTGLTRARQLAIVCGTSEALGSAIGRRINRESALLHALSLESTPCRIVAAP